MARVRTRLISANTTYHSPEGPVPVGPDRLQHWSDQFQKMKASGFKVPVPWGHTRQAKPGEAAFLNSQYNAGYLDEVHLSKDGQHLDVVLDIPAALGVENGAIITTAELPGGVQVKNAIKEVSAGLARKWIDGQKHGWDDIIAHVALVPHPVVHNQPGFTALSSSPDLESVQWLALGDHQWLAADDSDDARPPAAKKPEHNPADPEPDAGEGEDAHGAGYSFDKLLAQLAELGVPLPPDTSEENVCQHLWVATHALAASKSPAGKPPVQPGSQAVTEEQPDQMMLSLVRDKPEAKKAYDAFLADKKRLTDENASLKRDKAQARLDGLTKRFKILELPTAVVQKHFTVFNEQNLSLDAPGLDLDRLEQNLALAEDLIKAGVSDAMTQRLSHAEVIEVASPLPGEDGPGPSAAAQRMAKRIGVKLPNGTK